MTVPARNLLIMAFTTLGMNQTESADSGLRDFDFPKQENYWGRFARFSPQVSSRA